MAESTQHKLDRIRPPRVQITYDVEIGDAIQKKELPFVMGIMADLSGQRDLGKLKDPSRKFIEIDRDNFNDIMKSIAPKLDTLKDKKGDPIKDKDGKAISLENGLHFEQMDDFLPLYRDGNEFGGVVVQVPELWELFKKRQRLNDLLAKLDTKIDSSATLDDVLSAALADQAQLQALKALAPAGNGEAAQADTQAKVALPDPSTSQGNKGGNQ
jgi:type VI secretion system protein ImpB